MAGYSGMILTKAGVQLQAQAQIGGELRITKIAIGDGILASGESVEDLTALKHQVMTLGIQDMQITDDGQSRIRALITNDNLNTGFFVREVGVFTKIGDTGTETLYSYTNAGDKADYLPNKGINLVEEVLEVYVIVGNAQNVTCNINDRVTLATKQDLSEHTTNINNPHNTVASQIANTLISGLGTTDVQSTLAAIFKEATKKSGSTHNVVVTGPVSNGMANVLRDRYSDNLCVNGTPISGGDNGTYAMANAFDNNLATNWTASQTAANQANTSFIGYNFAVAKAICKLYVNQASSLPMPCKLQYSDDGTAWTDSGATFTTYYGKNKLAATGTTTHKYWRLLATANLTTSSVWSIFELEMYALLNPDFTDSDILIQANALVSFAAGFDLINKQPLDYWELTQQMSLILAAADAYTVPLTYTDDICNGGTAISGGDFSGYPAANAFDNNSTVFWKSSQLTPNLSGVASIGYNYGTPKAVRKIAVITDTVLGYNVTSVKVQYSSNGTIWTDACTVSQTYGTNYITVPAVGAFQYWRLLANSTGRLDATTGNSWIVQEIEMYEALQTYYVYLTRDANGNVTAGSTRNKPRTVKPVTAAATTPGYYTNDLCNGGMAISGGDNTTLVKENAFDNNISTNWGSSQIAANQSGVAYIGYDFGVGEAKTIRKLSVTQHPATVKWMPSVKVQYSDNGTVWTDAITTAETSNQATAGITFPNCGSHRYWRILANGNITTSQTWDIYEIEMYEYVDPSTSTVQSDDTTYSDNLCIGGAAIATSEQNATSAKENAFDGNSNTYWTSNLTEPLLSRAIGYDFGVSHTIRKIVVTTTQNTAGTPSAFKVQKSTDGTTWTDVLNYTGIVIGVNTIYLPAGTEARYWRLLANGVKLSGSTLLTDGTGLAEITMHEISTDINLYDSIAGVSKHYDGSTWDNVVRIFIGEAVVDSAGNIVSYITYPYNKARMKALPAEDSDDTVTLGQLSASLAPSGWTKMPVMVNGLKLDLIVQWGFQTITSGSPVTQPIAFPHGGFIAPIVTLYNVTTTISLAAQSNTSFTLVLGSGGAYAGAWLLFGW